MGHELQRRSIKAGIFCNVCGRDETIYHRFWGRPHSSLFWKKLRSEKGIAVAIPPCQIDSQSALSRWMREWFAEAQDDECAVMIQAVYALWLARNEARDGKRIEEPHEIMNRVVALLDEWKTVHGASYSQREPKRRVTWIAPEEGWVKANSDGALSKQRDKGGARCGAARS